MEASNSHLQFSSIAASPPRNAPVENQALPGVSHDLAYPAFCFFANNMQQGAVIVDRSGKILYVNESFANMVNIPFFQLPGSDIHRFFSRSFTDMLQEIGEPFSTFVPPAHVDLQPWGAEMQKVALMLSNFSKLEGGAVGMILTGLTAEPAQTGALGILADSLWQKSRELAIATQELLCLTHLSRHDLKEPLRKIQTFANFIQQEEGNQLTPRSSEYFTRMVNAALRMERMIDDLHAYAHTSLSERRFEVQNLDEIMKEVVEELADVIREKEATIHYEHLGSLRVIQLQFRQLIYNLVSNALKFSAAGRPPVITITSEEADARTITAFNPHTTTTFCHITIRDNGIGFDSIYKERIFKIFERLHSQDAYNGTGIGLAICKRIVENHQGFITASGKAGTGAQFDIYLPAAIKDYPSI